MFRETLVHYFSIFLGVLFVVAGSGLLSMYFPIYAKESISGTEIGLITSAYFVGFFIGCIKTVNLIQRVGHIRTFMFMVALIGGTALLFTMVESTLFWFPLRLFMGIGYAGIYVVIESWINAVVVTEYRGRVYGTYRLVELTGLAIGQHLMGVLDGQSGHFHFSMITLLTVLSTFPLCLTLLPQPVISRDIVSINIKRLWAHSPYSTGMMFLIGMATSVIWMLTPLFLSERGFEQSEIPKTFLFFILGGIISQYPIGLLSDKYERRGLINIVASIACLIAYGFSLPEHLSYSGLFFCLGASVMPQYSLIMTHAMDKANPDNAGTISSQMLMLYATGAICGPVICGHFIDSFGLNGQPFYLVSVFAVMLVFGLKQKILNDPVSENRKKKFKIFPQMSPVILRGRRLKRSKANFSRKS